MLPSVHRMRRSRDIDHAVRRGVRSGAPRLVVHLAVGEDVGAPTVGFAVSRAVGSAVVRNRVKRRLRHLVADRVDRLPQGARLVVRALPPAAAASSAELAADLDSRLAAALRRATSGTSRPART